MRDETGIYTRIKKAYFWIIFGQGSTLLLTVFYTPILVRELGSNYGLIAIGSLVAYFIATFIDAVTAWTYNHSSKNHFKNEHQSFDVLRDKITILSSIAMITFWVLISTLMFSSVIEKFQLNSDVLFLFFIALCFMQLSTFLMHQFESANYSMHKNYILQRFGVLRKLIGVMLILLYYFIRDEIVLITIILAHGIEIIFTFIVYWKRFGQIISSISIESDLYISLSADKFFHFIGSHILSGQASNIVLFGFSYLVAYFFEAEVIAASAAVMIFYNLFISYTSLFIKPLYSVLSENFYNSEQSDSVLKKSRQEIISTIFNVSLILSLLFFWIIYSFGVPLLSLWLDGLYSEYYNLLAICICAIITVIPSRSISYTLLFSGKLFTFSVITIFVAFLAFLYSYFQSELYVEMLAYIYVIASSSASLVTIYLSMKHANVNRMNIFRVIMLSFFAMTLCLLLTINIDELKSIILPLILSIFVLLVFKERRVIVWAIRTLIRQ